MALLKHGMELLFIALLFQEKRAVRRRLQRALVNYNDGHKVVIISKTKS